MIISIGVHLAEPFTASLQSLCGASLLLSSGDTTSVNMLIEKYMGCDRTWQVILLCRRLQVSQDTPNSSSLSSRLAVSSGV